MAQFYQDAKARLQHTNKLSLAPKDLKNLADIIATEKNVLSTSSKLSVDYRKAAEALKEWGLNEGDDLGDILPKLSILFGHLADAQARFSDHEGTYRIHFKSIRMREESLSTLKKSREAVQAKITGLEKKITKMSSENKDLPSFTTRLQESRAELVSLENSVAIEEARLSDFKRETVREGLSLRLGAMLELAEKMTIVCQFGRVLTAEVPMERTPPGSARAPYCAASKTQAVVEEAQQCLTQVVFNPTPSPTRANAETSPMDPSFQLPVSDHEHSTTLHPNTEAPKSFSTELPPLYFDGATLENPVKPPTVVESPNHMRNTGTSEAHSLPNHIPFQSYNHDRDQNSGRLDPSSQPSHNTDAVANLLASPHHGRLETEEAPSYGGNAFYVLDRDGVPQSTSPNNTTEYIHSYPSSAPGNPTEHIQSHPSSNSRPVSTAQPEASRPVHHIDYHIGPREYPAATLSPTNGPREYQATALPPTNGSRESELAQSRTNETDSVNSERLPYSPRHHELLLSPRSSGTLTTEGRTTNAGAFRRAVGSNIRSPGSNQSMTITDEALTTGSVTSVHPLHIHKRDSRLQQ